jgi:perosamine synthetase
MKIRKNPLKVLGPHGDESDVQAIREVIESGWWGKGPKVQEFEEEFAKLVGSKHAIAVTSNSHGQDLVMKAMGFKGHKIDVINPTISFVATAEIPLWNGCTSNIVDVDKTNLNITPEEVEKWKKPTSEVLIAVNMAGIPAPIDEIRKVFGGFIIEDCAHSCYTGGAGTKGDVAVWSFQAVKTLPIGDGGMITLNDDKLANKIREMLWFGVTSTWSRAADKSGTRPGYAWDYQVDKLGYKYYMIDIIAALGLSQLKKLPTFLKTRRHIQHRYNEELSTVIERPPYSDTVQYYCARLPEKRHNFAPDGTGFSSIGRDQLINYLADKKIHTSVHFKPLHLYKLLEHDPYLMGFEKKLPVSEQEWVKLISLPCHNGMTDEDIDYVVYWVNKFIEEEYEK